MSADRLVLDHEVDVQAERLRAAELQERADGLATPGLTPYSRMIRATGHGHVELEAAYLSRLVDLLAGQAEQIEQLKKERDEALDRWSGMRDAYDREVRNGDRSLNELGREKAAVVRQRDNLRDALRDLVGASVDRSLLSHYAPEDRVGGEEWRLTVVAFVDAIDRARVALRAAAVGEGEK